MSSHNTALTALFGGSAIAADLRRPAYTPPPPVSNWTGFYIGGDLGGAWARGSVNDSLFGLSASFHVSSEVRNYITIYLATVTSQVGRHPPRFRFIGTTRKLGGGKWT